ncbi:MAG: ribulose-phosphate 3-epimerase [Clostridia bacterium]|nr:ribulose-phosphate 3-epimerase [Clostridia bacterium]
MSKQIFVSPSTHPCPVDDLLDYGKSLLKDGADWLHCDIMDGNFVQDKTYDEVVLALLSKRLNMTMDVHLMVQNPLEKIAPFAQAGADIITVHFEALKGTISIINAINKIHDLGCRAGLSIKPNTPVSAIENYLPFLDLVLVMSVEPGKSGQTFMMSANSKIAQLNAIRKQHSYEFLIEVDGGVNRQNAGTIVSLGADALVLGNAMYTTENRKDLIKFLKSLGE